MNNNETNHFIGIDLGTTNSVVAFAKTDKNGKLKAQVIKIKALDEDNNLRATELLPSYVYFKENDSPIVGGAARGMITTQSSRVVKSIKSKMGEEYILSFDKKNYKPEDVSAMILSFIAKKTQELLRVFPKNVVITVPASFNSDQRTATIKAAEKAGFNVYDEKGKIKNILLDEPRAALFDFIENYKRDEFSETTIDLSTSKNILVFDLGGGTLDVSLHEVNYDDDKNKINIEDYSISRYTQIGGDNFDLILAERLKRELNKKGLDFEKLSDYEKNEIEIKLLRLAEDSKIDLNAEIINAMDFGSMNEEELNDIEISIMGSNLWDNRGIDISLTLGEYAEMVSKLLGKGLSYEDYKKIENIDFESNDNIIFPILDVLSKAEKKKGYPIIVDAVLLNGGMTKFYLIQKRIEDFFGFKPLSIGDEDKSVAKGAVYYHHSLHRGIIYSKIQNESIGVETEGKYVRHLIPAGTVLPYKSEVLDKFSVREDGATSLLLPFYLGERNDTKEPNRKIANRKVKFKTPLSAGTPISLQVEVDEVGIMSIKGWLQNSDNDYFEVSLETEKSDVIEDRNFIKVKEYQKVRILDKRQIKTGMNIDVEEMISKFNKIFYDRNFNNEEYKNMFNKIKNAKNAFELGAYFFEKYTLVSKENKTKIINILGEIGKDDFQLGKRVVELCIYSSTEKEILALTDVKDINRIIKDCVIAIGKIGENFAENHLLELLNSPYTLNIQEDIITAIGKVGYSKNSLKYLEKTLKNTEINEIGKRIRLIWSIAKIGSREKLNPIEPEAIIKSIKLITDILNNEKHKELVDKAIYALGELCDTRFGNEVPQKILEETIDYLEKISLTKGNKVQKIVSLIINMIKGNVLTKEEEVSLLSIRSNI